MNTQRAPAIADAVRTGSVLGSVFKPSLLIPVFVIVVIAGAVLPWVLGYASYGRSAIDRQIEQEDSSLCARFGFAPETERAAECKTALADLRRRHEQLMLY